MSSGPTKTIVHYSIVALILAGLLSLVFRWWFQADWLTTGVYALVSLVGVVSVPVIYRLGGFLLNDEMRWLESREAVEHQQLQQRLSSVRSDLESLAIEEGVRQADMLSGILDDYHSVVETRFIGKKHSPVAYLQAARQVQKHAVQNLHDVVAVGHSISTIERNESRESDVERGSVREDQLQIQRQRKSDLLEENRKLFDALTETAVEVANIKSFNRYERIDTLSRLVSLAEIASNSGKV